MWNCWGMFFLNIIFTRCIFIKCKTHLKSQKCLSWPNPLGQSKCGVTHPGMRVCGLATANRSSKRGACLWWVGSVWTTGLGLFELELKACDYSDSCSLGTSWGPRCASNVTWTVGHISRSCTCLPTLEGQQLGPSHIHIHLVSGSVCTEQGPHAYEVDGLQGGGAPRAAGVNFGNH